MIRRRLLSLARQERGSVTAEFAIILPALLLVFAVLVTGIMLGAKQLSCVRYAAELARLEARGDTAQATAVLASIGSDFQVSRSDSELLHCVTVSARGAGVLRSLTVTDTACAAIASEG